MVTTHEIEGLLERYAEWIGEHASLRQVDGWVQVTLPFLDRHNDYLQVLVTRRGDRFVLTDDSYVIEDLITSGCRLNTPHRQALLRQTLQGFGVELTDENALRIETDEHDFPVQHQIFVQAMFAVNDLFYAAAPNVKRMFLEDVSNWLDRQVEVTYHADVSYPGRSGYVHRFDFLIPRTAERGERIVQTLARPSRQAAERAAFRWVDTEGSRSPDALGLALLNDSDELIVSGVAEALERYDLEPVPWSERQRIVPLLRR